MSEEKGKTGTFNAKAIIWLVILGTVVGCNRGTARKDDARATRTSTITPTSTPSPSKTPTVIPSPTFTSTSIPTNTAVPTSLPTNTPVPTPLPTNTLVPVLPPTNTPVPTPLPTNTLVPAPPPTNTPVPPPPTQSGCHPSYQGACLGIGIGDYDCAGGSGNGPNYTGRVTVVGPDEFRLDHDNDGVGCE